MRRAEARDLTRATASAARGLAGVVEATHIGTLDVVYGRLRRFIGPAVTPVYDVHRVIATTSFGGVRAGLYAAGLIGELVVSAGPSETCDASTDPESILQQRDRGFALGVINGVAGDRLERDHSSIALPTTLRQHGRDVPLTTEALLAAYGPGHRRLVVFLHGLVETELSWRFRARQRWADPQVSYGSLLERDEGWLPLYLRYNSGAAITTSAERFNDLMDTLVVAWPEPIDELAIVGHSMGGLVAMTALSHDDRPWMRLVRAVVTLGSPRDGAPLERTAAVIEELTERTGWARWFGGLIGVRSGGIRDMHDPVTHPPMPDRIDEYAVLATLTPGSWHSGVPRIGDGLVPIPEVHHCETAVVHGLHHLDLLNHPQVYPLLRGWLPERRVLWPTA
ncbi:MAG: hypothetical protein WAR57_02785 [Candidatus Phosphoribacter sp.]|nr:hypothetical protein [Actinomycetales bacterium]